MITSLGFNIFPQRINNKMTSPKQSKGVNFCARLEYERLMRGTVGKGLVSNFFRRGYEYGNQNPQFIDVVNALKILFRKVQKPKILVVGVGKAQEPFSLLAVIKDMHTQAPLESVIDLHCVDLQPKISDEALIKYAYLHVDRTRFTSPNDNKPFFAPKSFEADELVKDIFGRYRVKPDIFEYLKGVFNNPERTKWNTSIEEFASVCEGNTYDMVSINNVIMYMKDLNVQTEALRNVCKIIKPGGILITDPSDSYISMLPSNFKNLALGIWQKQS